MPDEGSLPSPAQMRRRRRFAHHLLVFATVNAALVVVWVVGALATGSWFPWPLVPVAVWGAVLRLHRRSAYADQDAAHRDRA
ncbi:2TM domain-containing protein [Blastococcus sp. KM273129]|uniref:2TM domain-containing protein n=1 Tax=Blastococcus sp. KM273129 TaxID=2570315 RepID=UPI001F401314|nr:2TM domain-containing protein [Blastococcus sp. KM273129]MCF6734336.1 2TM domain-containing protein [Blastococcus sp. KM273129]